MYRRDMVLIMKMRSIVPMRIAKIGYVLISTAFCLIGIIMMVYPDFSLNVIGICCGIAMIIFGIVKLIGYFSKDLYRLAFQYDLQFGILMLIIGLIILLKPANTINFICISLGILITVEGLFKIQIAFEAKNFGIQKWWLIITLSIVTVIIGILLVFRPSDGARTLVILLGASWIAEGILNLCSAISMVKIVKNQMPDIVEISCEDQENIR